MNAEFFMAVKKAALGAVKEYGLTDIEYGTVESIEPISIRVNQKKLLDKNFLVLTKSVTDYEIKIVIQDGTEQKAVIKNGLKEGDRVMLLKAERGQQYVVLDKMEGA